MTELVCGACRVRHKIMKRYLKFKQLHTHEINNIYIIMLLQKSKIFFYLEQLKNFQNKERLLKKNKLINLVTSTRIKLRKKLS